MMTLHPRTLTAGAILACILSAFFCSKKSTGPSGDGDGTTTEKTATIGSEGGELAVEDFILSVPPGAFSENCTLRLYADPDDNTFEESRATRVFRIEDFPEDFAKPIRLAIRCSRAVSGETFMAEADSAFDPVTGGSAGVYRYWPASDSSGHLVCVLTPDGGETPAFRAAFRRPSASLKKRTREILGIDGQETRTTARFKVIRNAKDPFIGPIGQAVNDMLEQNWEIILEETGLDFSEKWPDLPVNVFVGPFNPDMAAGLNPAVACIHYPGFWLMAIDQDIIASGQMSLIRNLSGMQMLQYSMLRYDILKGDMDDNPDPTDNWLHLAIMHWAEELFTDDPNYRAPMLFPDNEMAPFKGMVKGATALNAHHDRGMSAVIKFLLRQDYFTRADIYNTYQAINGIGRSAPQDPTEAFLSNVNELITVWWPDFFKSYISGGVYGVAPSVFLDPFNLSGTWTIDPDGASEKVFSSADSRVGAYPDLSAKLFLVDAGDEDMPENTSLSIDVDGEVTDQGLSSLVFAVHPNRLEYLGGGPASEVNPEIRNLKANAEGGVTRYLICVVNSTSHDGFLGSSEIDLNLRLVQDVTPPAFNGCSVECVVTCELESVRASSGATSTRTMPMWVNSSDTLPGAMTDQVFQGSIIYEYSGTTYNQTVTVTANSDFSMVTHLDYHEIATTADHTTEEHLVASNIPVWTKLDDEYWFKLSGEEVCTAVSEYSYVLRSYQNGSIYNTTTAKQHWCTSGSHLSVVLKKR